MIITRVLCYRYTKSQAYMQYGIISVKNLIGCLGIHDKMDHTLEVRSLSLGEIIERPVRVTLFWENTPTIWDQHRIEGTFKLSVFTPKVYTSKSLPGPLPPDSGSTQKIF